jgi:serine/threonine protein kinase
MYVNAANEARARRVRAFRGHRVYDNSRAMGSFGRYTIFGRIASGGMASVYFARVRGGEGFARTVAVKRLHPHLAEDPAFRATLIDEARMAARIHHPNVVPTLDVFSEEGEVLVVMEYVRGESLARLLKPEVGRPMPLPIASAIAVGALYGLHAAHEAKSDRGLPLGIVHRDVSPQNILVGTDGLPRVIDFGVAKAAGRLQITRDGAVKGKRAYMAPEQIAGDAVTPQADVYAMGVILWEMLAAERLFCGDNESALAASVLAGVKEPPSRHTPGLPAALDALVMRAVARNPEERFASAQEMAEALVRVVTPALSADVGRWVEDLAHAALAERGAQLADLENASGGSAPESTGGEAVTAILVPEPSSLSVETKPSTLRGGRVRRLTWSEGLAASGMLVVGLTIAIRGSGFARSAPGGASTTVAAAGSASSGPRVSESAAPVPSAAPDPVPVAVASPSPSSPPPRHGRASAGGSTPSPSPPQSRPSSASNLAPRCSVATDYDAQGQPHFRKICK